MNEKLEDWNRHPLEHPIPLDREIIALWKNMNGKWKREKVDGYLFYQINFPEIGFTGTIYWKES